MLDRVYHVTAQGVLDQVMVQVTLVVIEDGHAQEVGSRTVYVQADDSETSQEADLAAIAAALLRLTDPAEGQ